jgi:GcrA cell cycle regulator
MSLEPRSNLSFGWTDEAVDTLKRLWEKGLSAGQIAINMGNGLTRNAILGKVHRLELGKRSHGGTATKAIKTKATNGREKAKPVKLAKPMPTPAPPPVRSFEVEDHVDLVDVTHLIGILDLKPNSCRWVEGDPRGVHGYCGRPKTAVSSYCPEHDARVYLRGRP